MWKPLKTISSPPPPELWLDLTDRRVPVRITRRTQARRMTLRLERQAEAVALTLPPHTSVKQGMVWVETKRGWIEGQLNGRPERQPITPGMTIMVAGETLILDWSPSHPRIAKRIENRIRIGGPIELLEQRLLRWLKAEARDVLTKETAFYAERAGVGVTQVGVGDPVSRWGSCTAAGAIRYSWRLILAPRHVMVATVAHEVAHRVHMNHSAQFHGLVADILGLDPRPARLWLRRNGASLHGFGSGS
jgi:predicted metal-dependent hydrolase